MAKTATSEKFDSQENSKIDATRCHILRQNLISAGTPPQTPLGEFTPLPRPLDFRGLLPSGGREREERGRGNKSTEWLSQKLVSTANAAVNS